jgi:hypothetical protein
MALPQSLPIAGARVVAVLCLLLAGCEEDLGPCGDAEMELARTPVWDESGLPAYEGQALIDRSCGNGSFCHSAGAVGDKRFGAPAELNFDMAIASADETEDPEAAARLRAGQLEVYDRRHDIFDLVSDGTMPPGDVGGRMVAEARVFIDDRDLDLPEIDSSDGNAILKNWLACGSPVVERAAGAGMIGDTVPIRGGMVDPTWSSIYQRIIAPTCAGTAFCHNTDGGGAEGNMDMSDKDMALMNLINVAAMGEECGDSGRVRVVPGDPDSSLLIQKLEGPDCGSRMPLSRSKLSDATIQAFRDWIADGAQDN